MKKGLLVLLACFSFGLQSQNEKLVIGLVVDQMRADYLFRFQNEFGKGGFNRLMKEGVHCTNVHYNYMPTYTGPGHASIFTGATPKDHGIIANNWHDPNRKGSMYCVMDDDAKAVNGNKYASKRSPKNLLIPTLGDAIRLSTQFEGRSYGISIKDRSAILPVGFSANHAFWYDHKNDGAFISSSYYQDTVPEWLTRFNEKKPALSYLNQNWEALYDYEKLYHLKDERPGEWHWKGKENTSFPYDLKQLALDNKGAKMLSYTPFSNDLLVDLAENLITAEQLGQRNTTDFLSLSFSSPDKIGHLFGPNSWEIADNYIRLDQTIERLLNYLDTHVGKGKYVLFLTADHAVAPMPDYLQAHQIPAGRISEEAWQVELIEACQNHFKLNLIENLSNQQVFLNETLIQTHQMDRKEVLDWVKAYFLTKTEVHSVYFPEEQMPMELYNGYYAKRSGDVLFTLLPNYFFSENLEATTHGTSYRYDTHVPLLFYGGAVKPAVNSQLIYITQIVPSICNYLNITPPASAAQEIILLQ